MSRRLSGLSTRILTLTAAALALAVLAALATTARAGAAVSGAAPRGIVARCVRLVEGRGRAPAPGIAGSANPQVTAELSILRAPRTAADTLPAAGTVGRALAAAGAATFDPSASVRLDLGPSASGSQGAGTVYAVPATLTAISLPAQCTRLRALAGLRMALSLRNQETGTGPGVCLVATSLAMTGRPIPILPGKRPPRPRHQTLATAGCESLSVMGSYLGALAGGFTHVGLRITLVPDGVTSVTYAFSDGRRVTATAHGNLLTLPALFGRSVGLRHPTSAQLRRALAARAPVSITENGPSGAAVATYARPPGLIGEYVRLAELLRRSFVSGGVGSQSVLASCSARTHRCVAAVITVSCHTRGHRCTATRRIRRYRYVGAHPPRGTTGHQVVPTAPIRARLTRYLARPGKVSLVLSGAPQRRVDAIVAVTCFSSHGSTSSVAGGFGQPLQVAVPSRTPLALPRRSGACDVNVLVVSGRRGAVHARLSRG